MPNDQKLIAELEESCGLPHIKLTPASETKILVRNLRLLDRSMQNIKQIGREVLIAQINEAVRNWGNLLPEVDESYDLEDLQLYRTNIARTRFVLEFDEYRTCYLEKIEKKYGRSATD